MEVQAQDKSRRLSFMREFKLYVTKWYMDNCQNQVKTAFYVKVERKRAREWVQNQELIRATKLTPRKKISLEGKQGTSFSSKKGIKCQNIKNRREII